VNNLEEKCVSRHFSFQAKKALVRILSSHIFIEGILGMGCVVGCVFFSALRVDAQGIVIMLLSHLSVDRQTSCWRDIII